jgi:uroporphyrinogen decarboxylase
LDKIELYREIQKQKTEITPSERMALYLKGEEVDCQPYGLLAPEDALAHIWGYTQGEVRRSFDLRCELIRRKRDEYGFAGLSASVGLRGIGQAIGSKVYYPENSVDYISEHFVTDYSKLRELEDFEVSRNPFLSNKLVEASRLMERFPDMGISTDVAGPMSTVVAMRSVDLVLRDIHKDPENLHNLLAIGVDCSLKWIEEFHRKTGSKSIGFADPVTSENVLGMKHFQIFSKPYIKRLIDGIIEITGQKPSLHICGHTKNIWGDLMEIGVNNFSLDNCESLEEAKKIMGEKVFLLGNVDPVDVMRRGSIDMVIDAVKKSLLQGSDNPAGYMLMTGCQVPIGTPKENIDAYIYAVKKYGARARKGQICCGLLND